MSIGIWPTRSPFCPTDIQSLVFFTLRLTGQTYLLIPPACPDVCGMMQPRSNFRLYTLPVVMSSMTLIDRAIHLGRRGTQRLLTRSRDAFNSAYRGGRQAQLLESIAALRNEVSTLQDTLRHLRSEFAGQISFLSHDLAEQIGAMATRFDQTGAGQLDHLQSAAQETQNRLIHLDTSLHSRFNEVLNLHFPGILEQLHEVAAFQLRTANQNSANTELLGSSRPRPVNVESFDAILSRAERDFPTVFAAWKQRLDEHRGALAVSETGNAANAADSYSRLFRAFVENHAEGAVLDVGCGPSGKPFYLSSYPSQLVSGIDPLSMQKHDDIEVIQGISEYLPWPDKSFSTVISATSMDHCLSLDRSIDETIRVLRPAGKFLLWLGSIPGSPPYRPLDAEFTPADRFHLFHFDIAWLEPMLERRFSIADRVKLDRAGYSHVFYCLCLKRG